MDERVTKRFEEMVALGRQVLATRRAPAPGFITSDFIDVTASEPVVYQFLKLD
jgi:hypothetical protein